jgi:hypothetical protein
MCIYNNQIQGYEIDRTTRVFIRKQLQLKFFKIV